MSGTFTDDLVRLWRSVVLQALLDAGNLGITSMHPNWPSYRIKMVRDRARKWFKDADQDFIDVTTLNENRTNGTYSGASVFRRDFTPTAEVVVKDTDFNLQTFKTDTKERQICSAPNTVELSLNISEKLAQNLGETEDDKILTKEFFHDLKVPPFYKFCVVDWDDRNDKYSSVNDVFDNKPNNLKDILSAQDNNIFEFKEIVFEKFQFILLTFHFINYI